MSEQCPCAMICQHVRSQNDGFYHILRSHSNTGLWLAKFRTLWDHNLLNCVWGHFTLELCKLQLCFLSYILVDVVEKLFTTRGRTLCSHIVLCEGVIGLGFASSVTPSHRTIWEHNVLPLVVNCLLIFMSAINIKVTHITLWFWDRALGPRITSPLPHHTEIPLIVCLSQTNTSVMWKHHIA